MPLLWFFFLLKQFVLNFRARIFMFTDGIEFDAVVNGPEFLVSFP